MYEHASQQFRPGSDHAFTALTFAEHLQKVLSMAGMVGSSGIALVRFDSGCYSGESKRLEHTVNWTMSVNLESEIMIRKAYCLCCKHTGTLECVAA